MDKRLGALIVSVGILLSAVPVCADTAVSVPAEWAEKDVRLLTDCGVVPRGLERSYTSEITRAQFAQLLYNAYQAKTGEKYLPRLETPFRDTESAAAAALYELGIMGGDENGNFAGERCITRQEAAKMLCIFYGLIREEGLLTVHTEVLKRYADQEQIGDWAKKYVAFLTEEEVLGDLGDGMLHPLDAVTVQQALVMVSRIADLEAPENSGRNARFNGAANARTAMLPAAEGEPGFVVKASWREVENAEAYDVVVTEWRDTVHGEEIGAGPSLQYTVTEPEISFTGVPNRRYVITVSAGGVEQTVERRTPDAIAYEERLAEMEQAGLPRTQEEADALMEEITVDVWQLQDGEKVASTLSLTVHYAIADRVKQIFREIFEGDERFPIYSAGAYAWRGGKTEHNWGTAIDINPDENYCLYTDGTVVGNLWEPYENPYSVTPFGDVVRTFEKYGFTWGGDEWRGNRDFMHFSYLGT